MKTLARTARKTDPRTKATADRLHEVADLARLLAAKVDAVLWDVPATDLDRADALEELAAAARAAAGRIA